MTTFIYYKIGVEIIYIMKNIRTSVEWAASYNGISVKLSVKMVSKNVSSSLPKNVCLVV